MRPWWEETAGGEEDLRRWQTEPGLAGLCKQTEQAEARGEMEGMEYSRRKAHSKDFLSDRWLPSLFRAEAEIGSWMVGPGPELRPKEYLLNE